MNFPVVHCTARLFARCHYLFPSLRNLSLGRLLHTSSVSTSEADNAVGAGWGGGLLHDTQLIFEEHRGGGIKCRSDNDDGSKGDVLFASFDLSDIGTVKAGVVGEAFLAEAGCFAGGSDVLP